MRPGVFAVLAGFGRASLLVASIPAFAPASRVLLPAGAIPAIAAITTSSIDATGMTVPAIVLATSSGLAVARPPYDHLDVVAGLPPGSSPIAVAVGDLDGDGRPDVLLGVARPDRSGLFVPFRGLGDGRFAAGASFPGPLPSSATGLALGDLDHDGRPEIVVASGSTLTVLDGLSHGVVSTISQPTPTSIAALRLADVDGDGSLDIVATFQPLFTGVHPALPMRLATFPGDGHGHLGAEVSVALDSVLWEGPLLLSDIDADGRPDVIAATWNSFIGESRLVVLGGGLTGFREGLAAVAISPTTGIVAADLDGDGRMDLVSTDDAGRLLLHPGRPGPSFTAPIALGAPRQSIERSPGAEPGARLVGGMDVDGDGRIDLVLTTPSELVVLRNTDRSERFLPVVLSSPRFRTELVLTNHGPVAAQLEWTYTASVGGGSGSTRETIERGRQRVIPDAFTYLREHGVPLPADVDRIGTLRLVATGLDGPADLALLARVVAPHPGGSVGVSVPGLAPSELLVSPPGPLPLLETADERTNLALVNAGSGDGGDVVLRVTIGEAAPLDVRLSPGEWRQLDRPLSRLRPGEGSGTARIERIEGTAPYFAYVVVNDNVTNDGTYIGAVAAEGAHALLLPVAVIGDQPYATDLLRSKGSAPISLTLLANGAEWNRSDGPFAQFAFPRTGPPLAGPVTITPATLLPAVTLSTSTIARITVAAPEGGRHGVAVPTLDLRRAARRMAWVSGLRKDAATRSNLAISIPSGDGTFTVELFDGETGALAAISERRVSRFAQWSLAALLPDGSTVTNAYARVTQRSGTPGFVAYGVVNDGAAPGLGTGDGSYLPMQADIDP